MRDPLANHYHFGKQDAGEPAVWYTATSFEGAQGPTVEMMLQAAHGYMADVIRIKQHGPNSVEMMLRDPAKHYGELIGVFYEAAKACANLAVPAVGVVEAFEIREEKWLVMTCGGAACPGGDKYRPSRKHRKYLEGRLAYARALGGPRA